MPPKVQKKYLGEPLSDKQIRETLSFLNVPILNYEDLTQYNSFQHLFQASGDPFAIVLFNPSNHTDVGHWTCLIHRNERLFEFYDPLGFPPDKIQQHLYHSQPLPEILINLLDSDERLSHVPIAFQDKRSQNCGRFIIHRIMAMKMTTKEYANLLTNISNFMSPDEYMFKTLVIMI